jgi:hypothetical protein
MQENLCQISNNNPKLKSVKIKTKRENRVTTMMRYSKNSPKFFNGLINNSYKKRIKIIIIIVIIIIRVRNRKVRKA